MRSKEVEEAVKNCNLLLKGDIMLHILDDDGGTAYAGTVNKLYNKDLETVLNYIEELETKYTMIANAYNHLSHLNDILPKQVIRDKIEELERRCMLLLNNYEKCDTCEKESCSIRGKYLILKELLG